MSGILVFIQQEKGKINSAALSSLTAAKEVSSKSGGLDIVGICLGEGAQAAADAALKFGFSAVHWSSQPVFKDYIGLNYASAVSELAGKLSSTYVIAASTSAGKDFLPAVAAQLNAGMASEVLTVSDSAKFIRPMYAGNVLAEVEIMTSLKVISIRASAFDLAAETGAQGKSEEFVCSSIVNSFGSVLGFDSSATGRPELADAAIIVSGGRGVQSKEGFEKFINPLADALGAAIGASRAAVDAGFAPNDWQVGQTGKTVAPQLYIAVGISGAIQHIAGMKDSKFVVAINKDPEAPIFEVADFGLVADLEKAIPEFIELVKSGK